MSDATHAYRMGEATVTRMTETVGEMAPPERLQPALAECRRAICAAVRA